ncbi:hypothetical protein BC830DRAFT_1153427 [Chytriomyces sp. MP71]|nr:hypothetical protein BC830DRAFT_1153427 [Chytriomyces sp. MP71]
MDPTTLTYSTSIFWLSFLLTFFAGPLIGALPLCSARAAREPVFRGNYLSGIAFAFFAYAVLLVLISVTIAQTCLASHYGVASGTENGVDALGNPASVHFDCMGYYTTLCPVAVACVALGALSFRQGKRYLEVAERNGAGMTSGSIQQVGSARQAPSEPDAMPVNILPAEAPPAYTAFDDKDASCQRLDALNGVGGSSETLSGNLFEEARRPSP